ncbi:hypothetical protein DL98DRAFT_537105 [Cadophora sp. DSE1049]|nr:hypothetical protein DL98DRAFT_537105 [Cadophora sp. DSE1049]
MAEILGVVAGATQLAQYALKISAAISEVHDRVRGGTELLEYEARIQRLIDTTAEIKRNPLTCNYAVLQHLKSATEEANHLLDLLQRLSTDYTCGSLGKRYLKAARGGKYEKKIATSFQRLEQEKTSLIFCIGMGNTEQLHYISEDVKRIAGATEINMSTQVDRVLVKCIKAGHEELVPKEHQYTFSCLKCNSAITKVSSSKIDTAGPQLNSPQIKTSWKNCKVVGDSHDTSLRQINGNIGDPLQGDFEYDGCVVEGKGRQLNSHVSGQPAIIMTNFLAGNTDPTPNKTG